MPDPRTPGQWYIKTTNGERGPYPIEKLQRYVDAGAILPNAGLRDGQGPWVAAATVKGLTFPAEAIAKLRAAHRTVSPGSDHAAADPQGAAQTKDDAAPDQTRADDDDHQRRTAELKSLEQKLDVLAKTLDARGSELDARGSELDARGSELDARGGELDRREEGLQTRQEQLDSKGKELELLREELEQQRGELEQQRGELEQQREGLDSQSAQQAASLKDQEQLLADDRSRLAEQQAECEARRADLEQRESQLAARSDEVRQADSRQEAEREELDGRTQQLDQRAIELDQREQELVEREQAVGRREVSLQEQASSQAERETEIDGRHAEVMQLQREVEAMRDQVARQAEQVAESAQNAPPADVPDPSTRPTDAAEVTDATAESILREKRKLLQEFAARQASLSQREEDLMRRENELTRRELDIAVQPASSVIPEPAVQPEPEHELVTPEQATTEWRDVSSTDDDPDDTPPPAMVEADESRDHDADAAPSSWEDVLGRTDERADAYELAVNDDPRYAPLTARDEHELAQAVRSDEEAADSGGGASAFAEPEDASMGHDESQESDVARRDRLPSEILPSELPHYDGVSHAAESEGNVAVAPGGPASDAELNPLRRAAFEERFGPCCRYDVDEDPAMRVDVSVHSPEGNRDFMTLVTSGMSDYPIPMPNGQRSVRAELLLYVTHLDDLAIQILRGAAKEPYRKKKGLSIGTTGSLDGLHDLLPDSQQKDCVYMLPVIESDSKPIQAEAGIGGVIQLFWLMTITEAERKLIDTGGIHKFLSLLEKNSHAVFFDPMRECYVKRKRWFRR
ncbi:Suppressor of fused protein (SUFU) [Stieleria maiorica]|uniref:Suppressor of fused protein (SUFU) n=1 Tax=Stieleria maiorica TaxID=2795974 RepID=A0A5B9MMD6_9BACT|nr:suppressor of fused domain protein [Stieleria maiorica]QEG02562.1 Suppressor of fused protein (SUFU) [Stieleria maiorica]